MDSLSQLCVYFLSCYVGKTYILEHSLQVPFIYNLLCFWRGRLAEHELV